MQCNSCNKQIPLQFDFAFKNNQCPICGSKIIEDDKLSTLLELKHIATVYSKSEEFLDIILKSYNLNKISDLVLPEKNAIEGLDNDIEIVVAANPPKKITINPIKPVSDGQKLPSQAEIFHKRAGTDRLKNLVNEIKGKSQQAASMEDFGIDNEEESYDANPLSRREASELDDVFEPNKSEQVLEIERIRRMQKLGGGKVNRSE